MDRHKPAWIELKWIKSIHFTLLASSADCSLSDKSVYSLKKNTQSYVSKKEKNINYLTHQMQEYYQIFYNKMKDLRHVIWVKI